VEELNTDATAIVTDNLANDRRVILHPQCDGQPWIEHLAMEKADEATFPRNVPDHSSKKQARWAGDCDGKIGKAPRMLALVNFRRIDF